MADVAFLPIAVPLSTAEAHRPYAIAAAAHFQGRNFAEALRNLDGAYHVLRDAQPPNARFHKGWELHNMGAARIFSGDWTAGRRFTLLALVEDILSHPDGWDGMPAAENLQVVFNVSAQQLRDTAARVRLRVEESAEIIGKPEDIFAALNLEQPFEGEIALPEKGRRKAGQFDSAWEKRVFVGGSYRAALLVVNEVARACRDAGYDAVVEFDFDVPDGRIHDHGLMLLHECKFAVFDVTTQAGQLMELERARDYGITPLVIVQGTQEGNTETSAMIQTLSPSFPPKRYATTEELRACVRDYLSGQP